MMGLVQKLRLAIHRLDVCSASRKPHLASVPKPNFTAVSSLATLHAQNKRKKVKQELELQQLWPS